LIEHRGIASAVSLHVALWGYIKVLLFIHSLISFIGEGRNEQERKSGEDMRRLWHPLGEFLNMPICRTGTSRTTIIDT
jgi:hypothetical protein